MSIERHVLRFEQASAPYWRRARARKPMPCPCGCGTLEGMCSEHLERLARIKRELNPTGGRFGQRSDVRGKRAPSCCNPSCGAPRGLGQRYCYECQDNGWSEDNLE